MLVIDQLGVCIDSKEILKGFSLTIKPGEIHAIMGPNGAGKSTLSKVLAGHPSYEITSGTITFMGKDLLELEPEERVHLGLFMTYQYPIEVPGVSNKEFLFEAYKALEDSKGNKVNSEEFERVLDQKIDELSMKKEFLTRSVNEGFSGGEKKKNEILQMSLLDPKVTILDETDSGLDVDALKVVAEGVKSQMNPEKAFVVITHYQRLLDYIEPDFVHVMIDGKIVESGDKNLAKELDQRGYAHLC
jgi:Fe-S cluster assembly ATP-binding protein